MSSVTFFIGIFVTLIGLAIIGLTIPFLHANRVKNIISGIIFTLLGASIIWLNLQGARTFHVNVGISDNLFGFLLIFFIMCLFIWKGVHDIREGSLNLQDKTISSFLVFKSRFEIFAGIIITTFSFFILVVAFIQFLR